MPYDIVREQSETVTFNVVLRSLDVCIFQFKVSLP